MTSAEIWALNQRQVAAGQEPLANFSALMTGRSLANLARRQSLADIASERTFRTQEEERASSRRMKESAEVDRLRLLQKYSEMGVPGLGSKMTMEDANSKYQGWLRNKASTQLDIMDSQMGASEDKLNEAVQDVIGTVNSKMGTPQDRREALQVALASTWARAMPDEWRSQLQKILASNQDPDKAVQQVVERMQNQGSKLFGWVPFTGLKTPTTAFSDASNFFTSYSQALLTRVAPQQQAELMAKMQVLKDRIKENETIKQQTAAHAFANAALLPRERVQDVMNRTGSSSHDPNVIMSDMAKPNPVATPTPTPTDPAPFTKQPPPAPGQGLGAMGPKWENGALVWPKTESLDPMLVTPGNPLVNVLGGPMDYSPLQQQQADSNAQPVSSPQLAAYAGMRDAMANPNQKLIPVSPQERAQVEQFTRGAMLKSGMSPEQVEASIQKANQGLASGDASAIAGANRMLQIFRKISGTGGQQPGAAVNPMMPQDPSNIAPPPLTGAGDQ